MLSLFDISLYQIPVEGAQEEQEQGEGCQEDFFQKKVNAKLTSYLFSIHSLAKMTKILYQEAVSVLGCAPAWL